jgi:hypothetical protein
MMIQFLKRMVIVPGIVVLLGMLFAPGGTEKAAAGVGISVNIGLPALVFPTPPPVVVIPGTYVYAVPDIDVGLFFYQGYWYRPHEGAWYWASSYNGPWVVVDIARVPRVLASLPPGSWRVPPGYHRIPHAEMRENWRQWEHERHWERDREWQAGRHGPPEERGGEGWERGRGHEGHGGHEGRRG